MEKEISLVPAHQIDRVKWNRCISGSSNGLIYARSDYLDHMTPHWTGMVVGDYTVVMPIPWKKKYGIRYACSVPFIQQLGIFPAEGNIPYQGLMEGLFAYCRYGNYPFNWGNAIGVAGMDLDDAGQSPRSGFSGAGFSSRIRSNYILPLDRAYVNLEKAFPVDTRQNIRRSQRYGLEYRRATIEEATGMYHQLYRERINLPARHLAAFEQLCQYLDKRGEIVVRKSVDPAGVLLSVVLLLRDERRLYNIMNSTTPEGRTKEANYFLLAEVWKEYAATGYIFDFEGSDLPGVGEFYRKFGTLHQPYPAIHFNRLPLPLRWLKK